MYLNLQDIALFHSGILGIEPDEIVNLKCITIGAKANVLSEKEADDLPDVKAWVKEYNCKGNLYIGRNPRNEDGTVARIANIGIDIDTVGGDTKSSREAAFSILRAYEDGSVVCSGTGFWVFWKTQQFIEPTKEFEQKFRIFLLGLKKRLPGVKIDMVFDSARMTKLIGTTAFKNGQAFITKTVKFYPFYQDSIFKHIMSLSYDKPSELPVLGVSHYPSRSEADFALAVHYQKSGLSKEDCLRALKQHALGRNDREDDHKRIIDKVYGGNSSGGDKINLLSPKKQEDIQKYQEFKKEDSSKNIQTGFSFFDGLTKGIRIGDIYTIAGRPGIGKTNFALNISSNLCQRNKTVLYISTEMPYNLIWERMLKRHTMDIFTTFNFFVMDNFRPTIQEIRKVVLLLHPDILIFDHVQHIGSDFKTISEFVRGLKEIALEQRLAVIIVSQLKRPLRYISNHEAVGVKPTYDDLKGAGTLEEESSVVLLMYRTNDDLGDNKVMFDLDKNRYGLKGATKYELDEDTLEFKQGGI